MKLINYLFFFVLFSGCAGNQSIAQEKTKLFITAPSGLKLRMAPALTAKVLDVGTYGQSVQLIERNVSSEQTIDGVIGHWYRVMLEEQEGYMFGEFLKEEMLNQVAPIQQQHFQITRKLQVEENLIIKDIIVDNKSNRILRYYEEQKGFIISNGNNKYGGNKIPIIIYGLISESGNKIPLEQYEELVWLNNGKLITIYKNWEKNHSILRLYELLFNSIKLIKTVDINSTAFLNAEALENNTILVWEENEELGHSYALYDSGLENLSVTSPFKNGFNHIMHFSTNETITVLTKNSVEGSKIFSYNKDGILLDSTTLNLPNIRPWNIFVSKKNYIIYGLSLEKKQPVLKGMDRNSRELWEKKIVLPYHYRDLNFEIDQAGKYALAFTGEFKRNDILKISLLDLDTGNRIWEKDLNDIVLQEKIIIDSEKSIGLRPAALEILNNNKYFFVIGEMKKSNLVKFFTAKAFWVNQSGQIERHADLSPFQKIKLILEPEVKLISDDKILSNEK